MKPASIWFKNINFDIGGVSFSPSLYEAVTIVFLLFVLVLTLARLRHMYIKWSFTAWPAYFFMGFLFALVIEGFLLIGGRTILTGVLGWEKAPKPIVSILDVGRAKLVKVLGTQDEIPELRATESLNVETIVSGFQSLSPDGAQEVRSMICER